MVLAGSNNTSVCPDYKGVKVRRNGRIVDVCDYWNLDDHGFCKHNAHIVCSVFLDKNNIKDPWLVNFMNDFGCLPVKEVPIGRVYEKRK